MKPKTCILDIETESLEPTEGRIICIGLLDMTSGQLNSFWSEDEKLLLTEFLEHFKKEQFTQIVGFNIPFDLRFLFAKCLKYDIEANGFFSIYFIDLMMILKSVKKGYNFNKPGKLNDWLSFLFNQKKMFDGEEIPELYKQGKIKEIIKYNQGELELIFKLYQKIRFVLGDNLW